MRLGLVDRGLPVKERRCPTQAGTLGGSCRHCKPACHILCGLGGAGLFSDGKLNYIYKLGKTDLSRFMSVTEAACLIEETEALFNRFGMDSRAYPADLAAAEELRRQARIHGIDLLLIRQKHLGSDMLPEYIEGMCSFLRESGLILRTGETVLEVLAEGGRVRGVRTDKGEITAGAVILAPGRVGAAFMGEVAGRFGLGLSQRGIEVGVRVEVHKDILADLTRVVYDPTFFVRTEHYDDEARTFCTNPEGFVSLENYEKFVCVNGHALKERKSENSNFAFLSKVTLTDPVSDNYGYGEAIGRLAFIIGGGNPLLQRFGDLKRGRRSTWSRIRKGYITPTLQNAVPGDLSLALPERILKNIMEGLEQLNKVVPGVSNEETLLYAPEIKFFSTQVETDAHLETAVEGLFVAGDGPGVSGNIVGAAATGLIPAKRIGDRWGRLSVRP